MRSGARIAATNVVTLKVRVVDSGTTDPAGNPVPETVLDGTGDATVSSGGKTVTGTWAKTATDAVLTLAAADGVGADARARDHLGRAGPGGLGLGHDQLRTARLPRGGAVAWQPGRVQANDGGTR